MITGVYQAKGDVLMGFRKLDRLNYGRMSAARPTECLIEFIIIIITSTLDLRQNINSWKNSTSLPVQASLESWAWELLVQFPSTILEVAQRSNHISCRKAVKTWAISNAYSNSPSSPNRSEARRASWFLRHAPVGGLGRHEPDFIWALLFTRIWSPSVQIIGWTTPSFDRLGLPGGR